MINYFVLIFKDAFLWSLLKDVFGKTLFLRDFLIQKNIDEPKVGFKQLTDTFGLGRSYDADNDLSFIDNTIYIAGTHMGRASDWYDDIFKYMITRSSNSYCRI